MANTGTFDNRSPMMGSFKDFKHMSFFERLAINHAHPTKFILDSIGIIWMAYFLWTGSLLTAFVLGIGFSAMGTLLTFSADSEQLANSALGKYVVARLHPANLFFQFFGFVILMFGMWEHSSEMILAGVSFLILGHLWGWKRSVIR